MLLSTLSNTKLLLFNPLYTKSILPHCPWKHDEVYWQFKHPSCCKWVYYWYSDNLLHKSKLKALLRIAYSQIEDLHEREQSTWYITLPYLGNLSYKIAKMFKIKFPHLKVAFRVLNLVKNFFSIYCLPWKDCNSVYIGQTIRSLDISEHLNRTAISQFDKHLKIRNHQFDKDKCKIRHQVDNIRVNIDLLELLEFQRAMSRKSLVCLNNQIGTNSISPMFKYISNFFNPV